MYPIIVILVILWLLGFSLHLGGGIIHIVIVIALVLFLLEFFGSRGPGPGGPGYRGWPW